MIDIKDWLYRKVKDLKKETGIEFKTTEKRGEIKSNLLQDEKTELKYDLTLKTRSGRVVAVFVKFSFKDIVDMSISDVEAIMPKVKMVLMDIFGIPAVDTSRTGDTFVFGWDVKKGIKFLSVSFSAAKIAEAKEAEFIYTGIVDKTMIGSMVLGMGLSGLAMSILLGLGMAFQNAVVFIPGLIPVIPFFCCMGIALRIRQFVDSKPIQFPKFPKKLVAKAEKYQEQLHLDVEREDTYVVTKSMPKGKQTSFAASVYAMSDKVIFVDLHDGKQKIVPYTEIMGYESSFQGFMYMFLKEEILFYGLAKKDNDFTDPILTAWEKSLTLNERGQKILDVILNRSKCKSCSVDRRQEGCQHLKG